MSWLNTSEELYLTGESFPCAGTLVYQFLHKNLLSLSGSIFEARIDIDSKYFLDVKDYIENVLYFTPVGGSLLQNNKEYSTVFYISEGISKLFIRLGFGYVNVVGSSSDTVRKFGECFRQFAVEDRNKCYLITKGNGYDVSELEGSKKPLIRENYSPDVLEGVDNIIEDLSSSSPSGRLTIVRGTPGSGKTYLVRGILDELESASFIFVPSHSVQEVLTGNFINFVGSDLKNRVKKPITFFIEDGDDAIRTRDGNNDALVSCVLNLTSGLISETLDLRVIITTNMKEEKIDEAILRDGRLSYILDVDEVSKEQATDIYRRLVEDSHVQYEGRPLLSNIYNAARTKKKKSNKEKAFQPASKIGF